MGLPVVHFVDSNQTTIPRWC